MRQAKQDKAMLHMQHHIVQVRQEIALAGSASSAGSLPVNQRGLDRVQDGIEVFADILRQESQDEIAVCCCRSASLRRSRR
jgi:hypothetical protein